jgi:hypothetical protein
LEPKIKVENCDLESCPEALSESPNLNRMGTPAERSMENQVETNTDRYLDPDYPSREILLDIADKLLQLFEKR